MTKKSEPKTEPRNPSKLETRFTNQPRKAQHLSIAAWSFAKLGVSSPKLFGAIGHALSQRANELDPQGAGIAAW